MLIQANTKSCLKGIEDWGSGEVGSWLSYFLCDQFDLGTCVGIISQPENRSVEEPDQPDGTLSKRKSLTS
jgi:hypothetical protein